MDHHRADLGACMQRHQKTGGVRQVGENEIALGDPPLQKPVSESVHLLVELRSNRLVKVTAGIPNLLWSVLLIGGLTMPFPIPSTT